MRRTSATANIVVKRGRHNSSRLSMRQGRKVRAPEFGVNQRAGQAPSLSILTRARTAILHSRKKKKNLQEALLLDSNKLHQDDTKTPPKSTGLW